MSAACSNFRPNFWRPTTCTNCLRPKTNHVRSGERRRPGAALEKSTSQSTTPKARLPSQSTRKEEEEEGETEARQVGVVYPYAVVEVEGKQQPLSGRRSADGERRSRAPSFSHLPSSQSCEELEGRNKRRSRSFSTVSFAAPKPNGRPSATPKRKAPPPPLPRRVQPKPRLPLVQHTFPEEEPRPQLCSPRTEEREESGDVAMPADATADVQASAGGETSYRQTASERLTTSREGHATGTDRRTTSAVQTPERSRKAQPVELGSVDSVVCAAGAQEGKVAVAAHTKARVTPSTGQLGHEAKHSEMVYTTVEVVEPPAVPRRNKGRRTAPKKPPRTLSTFFDLSDLQYGPDVAGEVVEYSVLSEHSHPPAHTPASQLHVQLLRLMEDAVQRVYAKFLENVLRLDSMWEVTWQHLQQLSPTAVSYKGVEMGIERLPHKLDSCTECDIRTSQHLFPHPNLCLVRALLTPPSPPPLSSSSYYLLRDSSGVGTLGQLLPARREASSPEQFHELLLLCLVQLMSAVQFLYSNGVCHRDIGLDCLYVCQFGHDWLLKLGRFHYAVHHTGPVSAISFVYGYQELQWLGGADSRLPPEIMSTPENAQTLDYSGTDCFAVGCALYEMMGLENPFEVDPQLVYSQYDADNLPPFPHTSAISLQLQRWARLLLCRDPHSRLAPSAALLLVQALLWLPDQWLDAPVSEMLVHQQLDYDKASLVASLATMDIRPVPLSHALHANFLHSCNVSELIRTLSVYCQSTH